MRWLLAPLVVFSAIAAYKWVSQPTPITDTGIRAGAGTSGAAEVRWRKTAHGWENAAEWGLPISNERSAPSIPSAASTGVVRLPHPILLAMFQIVASLAGLCLAPSLFRRGDA